RVIRAPQATRDATGSSGARGKAMSRKATSPRLLSSGARAITPRLDGRWAKDVPGALSPRQFELERGIELADLADDALEALLGRRVRPVAPHRVQLQQLVLLHPQQLLLRVLVHG